MYKHPIGWYKFTPRSRLYHFGNGYFVVNWRGGRLYRNGCSVPEQEVRDFLKISKTDLYKAVYGI